MLKTTIYLPESDMRALKAISSNLPGRKTATLIRQAIQDLIRKKSSSQGSFLKKHLSKKPSKTSFGDPVLFQKKSRQSWS